MRARKKISLTSFKGVFLVLVFCALLSACNRSATVEAQLIQKIDTLCELAEAKNVDAMMAYFADDFVDFQGRTKIRLRSLLAGYLAERRGIVVHRLSARLEVVEASRAVAEVEVAVSSGQAEALRRLIKIAPDIYRIEVDFVRKGEEWLIGHAAWASLELSELFPESIAILKKIFPGI